MKSHLRPRTCQMGLALILMGGCQKGPDYPHVRLEGAITVSGQPLKSGSITATPTKSGFGSGASGEISEGRYVIEQCPQAEVVFTFVALRETGEMRFSQQADKEVPVVESLILDEYALGIPLVIDADTTARDFEL